MTRVFNERTQIVISGFSEIWTPEDIDAGAASGTDVEHDKVSVTPSELRTLAADMGIDTASASDPHGAPNVWFTSSSPRMDRQHIETGVSVFFSLHIQSIDGHPPTEAGIQRIADLIDVEFSVPLEIPAMPDAFIVSGDGEVTAIVDAAPWLAQATSVDIADLLDNGFSDTEAADEIYYEALRSGNMQARALASYLMSPDNASAGFEVSLDPGETMRWLEENRPVLHAQLSPDAERPIFGYYINLDERGEFYADVRNAAGDTVFEFRIDGESEDTIFTDGFMSDKNDLMGLKDHLVDLDILKQDDLLMDHAAFERMVEERNEISGFPSIN